MIVIAALLSIGTSGVADVTINGTVGGSVELPSALGGFTPADFVTFNWLFNSRTIARINSDAPGVKTQFAGRLQLSSDFSLTVRELTLQDSGVYQHTGVRKNGGQTPTHTIYLQVHDSITAVHIQKNVTSISQNLTCTVTMECNSSSDPHVSYTWRIRNKTVNGAHLHFSLSAQEGDIINLCTADKAISSNTTVRCSHSGYEIDSPAGLSVCMLKTALYTVGLAVMVSAVITVHIRERFCRARGPP